MLFAITSYSLSQLKLLWLQSEHGYKLHVFSMHTLEILIYHYCFFVFFRFTLQNSKLYRFLLIPGQETTANTMMFAIILLALHPNILERYVLLYIYHKNNNMISLYIRLQQEIKDVLGNRTTVTEKDLEEMQYTEQVCHKSC